MDFHAHLSKHHYAPVALGFSQALLTEAAELFLTFLTQVPNDIRRTLHFASPFERGSADGYSDKRGVEGKDPKEFFHWIPRIEAHSAYQASLRHIPEARHFFEAAKHIYERVEKNAVEVLTEELPAAAKCCIEGNRLPNATLRFLCYTPSKGSAFSAKPHYDKGIGTFALAESTPGLRIGCCDVHPLTTVPHREETALFMPADLLFEDSGRTIIPAWHDVAVPEGTKPISGRCERWAIVFFINDKSGRYSSWDAVHTPLPVHSAEAVLA